jgi:cytoskeletal protein RodZ
VALFKRSNQNKQSVLPDEVSQYYQSQRRERTGVALMLGVVALIVTLLIGAALFFGGRFVYRQFAGNDNNKTAQTGSNGTEGADKNKTGEDKTPASTGTSQPTSPSPSSSEGQTGGSPTPAPSPAPTPAPTPQTTPSTGDNPTLPHTGDPGM